MEKMKNLKMSQLALCNFPYKKYSLDYALDHLQALGAKKIEFYAADPHFSLFDCGLDDMKRVARKLRERDLQVIDICPENCTYPVNLASKNPATRKHTFDYYTTAIHAAAEWGAPFCNVFPGWANIDGSQGEAWRYGVDALMALADIAQDNRVRIVLEATSAIDTVLCSSEKAVQMKKEVGSPALTSLIDTLCLDIMGETMEHAINTIGIENVSHIHFSDGAQLPGGGWEHRVPGEGNEDLETMVATLDKYNYQGVLGCEVTISTEKSDNPDIVMQKTIDWCKERFILD